MPAAAASARPSTVRTPSRNGPVPRRQTRTANVAAAPARRAHAHAVRLIPAARRARGRTSRSAWSHGDGEPSGRRLRQTPARVGVGLGGQLGLAARTRRRPSRRTTPPPARPRRRRAARGSAGRRPRRPAGRTPRRRPRRRPGRAGGPASVVRRWWASNAAATRASSGSAGRQLDATDDRQRQQHGTPRAGADGDQPAELVPGQQVEQRRGGDQGRAGEIARLQPGDVGLPRLDGDRGAVGGRAGQVGGGDLEQVGVAVVHDPVLRPGQPRREPAAHRPGAAAEVVDHPARRVPGGVARGARRGRARGPRRRRARAARASPRLTRIVLDDHRDAPARTPARTDVVVDHPASDSRRSRAARRRRARSSASPSQARSAAPSAAGSPGGTSSPGRLPSAPCPSASGTPPTSAATTGSAARQRLGDDHAVGLGARRQHQQVGGGVAALEIGAGPRSREAHPVAQPGVERAAAEPLDERRVALQAAHAHAAATAGRSIVASASSSTSCPLPAVTAATHSSAPPAARPGRELGGVDGGLGDVHAVGRQRVQLEQPAPGPRARRDDGGGGREHRALARPRVAGRRRPGGGRAACARARPAAAGSPAARAPRAPPRRPARRAARRRRRGSAGRRRRARRTTPRRVAASCRARRARAPTSRARRARGRPGGRRRCRRSAAPGRRCRRVRRRAPPSQRPLVARPGDVRLVQRDDQRRRAPRAASPRAPACTRSASRSATTWASASVEVFMPAKAGSSSRLR